MIYEIIIPIEQLNASTLIQSPQVTSGPGVVIGVSVGFGVQEGRGVFVGVAVSVGVTVTVGVGVSVDVGEAVMVAVGGNDVGVGSGAATQPAITIARNTQQRPITKLDDFDFFITQPSIA